MCDGWNGEIQNLLIFVSRIQLYAPPVACLTSVKAGLFSAIVTAFSVEVAKELQEPPEAASVQLLARISAQLEANSSPTDIPLPQLEPFVAAPSTVRINLLWMISLTSSLAVVTIGILCLQWIRAYQRQYSGRSLKEAIAARNSRNSSLQSWHVPLIITLLPILLQVAVALFLIGLVEYFYHMNHTIGYVLGALVGTTLFFVVATTILPALCDFFFYYYGSVYGYSSGVFPVSCAYKSPQAWGFTMLCSRIVALWCMVFKNASRPVRSFAKVKNLANWSAYDRWWSHTSEVQSNYIWGLCRMARQFQHGDPVVTRSVYSCVRDLTTVQDLDHFNRYMYGPQERPLGQTFDPTQVNLIKDYVMYKVGLQMFSSSEDFHVPMGEWEHLHRLELFVRLYQNLPESFLEEVFVACPAVVDGSVSENRTIPRLPDGKRALPLNRYSVSHSNVFRASYTAIQDIQDPA
ncbi:hypothetical protein CC1G_02124 [Coprinopsis cinerea okayama7|uniref:DUF6535 domain-containing protein n=1 Tax=Coprinopsis cinerea (strain Okayama-7 / 130 / ATCC MYA-4618 / FGSC 9003) TaxID=240176 RepID=A8NK99_COPC7|nr:hypothetical protein CC1G_02124 [Coprinopsis cinerea okayama7\|eukprot:XP_001834388.2 hypothetical protein CC1G_02124 [Coprinopsis cinerea okayama7\